jgi:hypothetical protein
MTRKHAAWRGWSFVGRGERGEGEKLSIGWVCSLAGFLTFSSFILIENSLLLLLLLLCFEQEFST